jgi:predicted amidohydrolase
MAATIEQTSGQTTGGGGDGGAVLAFDPGAGPNLAPAPVFAGDGDGDGVPDGWYATAPRPALSPRFGLDGGVRRSGRWAATAAGDGNAHCFGKWGQVIPLRGGRHYRVAVAFRAEGIEAVNVNLLMALVWRLPGKPNKACPTDHLSAFRALDGDWTLAEGVFRAPPECTALDLELYFRFAPRGTVWWDSVAVQEVAAPAARPVTLAAVRWRPTPGSSYEADMAEIGALLDRAGHQHPDLICLPEMLNYGGRRAAGYEAIAEPLRGPTFGLLSRKAAAYRSYVLGCIYERDGDLLFNTAFLLDRAGELAGTYRKVHLYWPEEREGVSPGDGVPVFDTDFGRVGVMICYDSWFPEMARLVGLKGAEVLLFPNAGYGEEQVLARPGDNAMYLVASALNSPSLIAAPDGRVLTRTAVNGVVVATVDLADRVTAHPNAGGTLNASPGGKVASRHAPSLRLYDELLDLVRTPG